MATYYNPFTAVDINKEVWFFQLTNCHTCLHVFSVVWVFPRLTMC